MVCKITGLVSCGELCLQLPSLVQRQPYELAADHTDHPGFFRRLVALRSYGGVQEPEEGFQ
jgi:hypothetical protein